jgi:hypothetical protein
VDQLDREGGDNPLEIKCADAPKKEGATKFTKCEKEELCCKCSDINKQAKAGKLKRLRPSTYDVNRADGDNKCSVLNRAARTGNPPDLGFSAVTPECDAELRAKAASNAYRGFSPDHVQEIQLGGHPTAGTNLRWMSSAPNSWIGGQMKKFETTGDKPHTGVKPDCCN